MRELDGKEEILRISAKGQVSLLLCLRNTEKEFPVTLESLWGWCSLIPTSG